MQGVTKGETAFTGHLEYHKQVGKVWRELLDKEYENIGE